VEEAARALEYVLSGTGSIGMRGSSAMLTTARASEPDSRLAEAAGSDERHSAMSRTGNPGVGRMLTSTRSTRDCRMLSNDHCSGRDALARMKAAEKAEEYPTVEGYVPALGSNEENSVECDKMQSADKVVNGRDINDQSTGSILPTMLSQTGLGFIKAAPLLEWSEPRMHRSEPLPNVTNQYTHRFSNEALSWFLLVTFETWTAGIKVAINLKSKRSCKYIDEGKLKIAPLLLFVFSVDITA
jgi:hypothetical protein